MPTSNSISLQRATPDMAPMLSSLLELYVHDLSEIFPVELGPEGRFGYCRSIGQNRQCAMRF